MSETASPLQAELAEIDAIYRTAPIGLCVLDRALRFVRINDRLAEMNGVPASEHIGRTVREIVPALADRVEPLFRQVLDTGAPIVGLELKGETLAQPGVQRTWLENYLPLRDGAGRVVGINISVQEVTAIRRLEAERARQAHLRALAARLHGVREQERTHLARELHDELGQVLTVAKLELHWVAGQVPAASPAVRERLRHLDTLLETTMRTVRRISEALRPPMLDLIGLAAAIDAHVSDFEAHTGIRCTIALPPAEPALPPETATALFRILQEALTNAARHAEATRVEVAFREEASGLVLEVRDNGRGIPEAAWADPKALGLLGMRERALMFGGAVTIHGRPGTGTTVSVAVPRAESATARPSA